MLKLMKKGRLQQEQEKGIVKTSIQETPDMRILHCFWLVLDLMEIIVSHGIGKYPLVIALYGNGISFAVYDCKKRGGIRLMPCTAILTGGGNG